MFYRSKTTDRHNGLLACFKVMSCAALFFVGNAAAADSADLRDGWYAVAQNSLPADPVLTDVGIDVDLDVGPGTPTDMQEPETLLLAFELNGEPLNRFDAVLVTPDGQAFIRAALFDVLRLAAPTIASGGKNIPADYRSLDRVPGLSYRIDRQSLVLRLTCEARCFQMTTIVARRSIAAATPSDVRAGGFLNYDINVERAEGDFDISSLFEIGGVRGRAFANSTFAGRDLSNGARFVRLETSLQFDHLDSRRRLTLGDSLTRNASWSQPVRFAGIQFGNEFSLSPGFVTVPTPDFAGAAALPSTIDVFVNGVRRFTGNVPAGPYTIRDLPVLTGTGEAQVIVRDVLGREQVFSESYATGREMLRAGLSDWSVATGFLREEFAVRSGRYGAPFVTGLYAAGVTDALTVEAHGQLSADVATIGAGLTFAHNELGIVNATIAGSTVDADGRRAQAAMWGAVWDWSRHDLSMSVSYENFMPRFRTLGQILDEDADKSRLRVTGGTRLAAGHLSAAYVDIKRRSGFDFRSVSLNYSLRLSRRWHLTINGFRQILPTRSDAVSVSLSTSFGNGATGALSADTDNAGNYTLAATYQRAPAIGGGFGYRLRGGRDEADRFSSGSLLYKGSAFETSIGWSSALGQTQMRATARSGIVMAGGYVRPARFVTNSYAIVDLADQPGVRVYADRRLVGTTGEDGSIVVTNLRPFQRNIISLDAADLPLNWSVTKLEYDVVPAYRTGHVIAIEGGFGRSVMMSLRRADGTAPPVGAQIGLVGQDDSYFVGEDGFAYVAGVTKSTTAIVSWIGGSCSVMIELPQSDIPQIMMGEVECR